MTTRDAMPPIPPTSSTSPSPATGSVVASSLLPWRSATIGWLVTVLVLIAGVPLFLCMPPWNDVTLHDMAARGILRGKVHYQYVFDTNLPGIDWAMAAIRAAFGWSYEVLRAWDLLVIGLAAGILGVFARRSGAGGAAIAWYAAAVALFYPFTSEFNHCQRDPWMLLPASLAAWLRVRQLARAELPTKRLYYPAVLEGLVWGAAVWIKPHAVIVAAVVWCTSAVVMWRGAGWRSVRLDLLGLLTGGVLAGASGTAWLVLSGAWPYFWDIFMTWNPEYMKGVWELIPQRVDYTLWVFRPWSLMHLFAIPIALFALWRMFLPRWSPAIPMRIHAPPITPATGQTRAILAALYLAWLAQVVILQKGFDYVQVPVTILAMAVLAGQGWSVGFPFLVWFVVVGGMMNATEAVPSTAPPRPWSEYGCRFLRFEKHPLADKTIIGLWPQCWQDGSTPELRDKLGQYTDVHCGTTWQDLDSVASFLRTVDPPLRDRELNCWHDSTHPLYLMLNLDPATRYMHYGTVFPLDSKVPRIRREVMESPQRYVVSDLRRMTYALRQAYAPGESGPYSLPAWLPRSQRTMFPWSQPVVYRSGRYVVHRIVRPPREDEINLPDWFHLDELGPGK